MLEFRSGDEIHGFAGGYFGRDSYACRRVEAVGTDWIVTRNSDGQVELVAGVVNLEGVKRAQNRDYCAEDCLGSDRP